MKRILFFDEERVLGQLERALAPLADRWQMTFSRDETLAQRLVAEGGVDVLVSDSALPDGEGSLVLSRARKERPSIVRLLLVDDEQRADVEKDARLAHQLVPRHGSQVALATSIARACALHSLLSEPRLTRLAERLEELPDAELLRAAPRLAELDLASVRAEWERCFGALAARAEACSPRGAQATGSSASHALAVAVRARAILAAESAGAAAMAEGFVASLLHDLGELVLAAEFPERYRAAQELARRDALERTRLEARLFGGSHAALGAYLLGLAGLSTPIIEAVAFHHRPSQWSDTSFGPLAAVHVANALAEAGAETGGAAPSFDLAFLRRIGLEGRIDAWIEACALALEG